MALFRQGDATASQRLAILREQRTLLAGRMADMQATLDRLDFKIARYDAILLPREQELAQSLAASAGSADARSAATKKATGSGHGQYD